MNDPIEEAVARQAAAKAKLDQFTAQLQEHAGRVVRLYGTMAEATANDQDMALPNAAVHLQKEMHARVAAGPDDGGITADAAIDHLANVCVTLAQQVYRQQAGLRSQAINKLSAKSKKQRR